LSREELLEIAGHTAAGGQVKFTTYASAHSAATARISVLFERLPAIRRPTPADISDVLVGEFQERSRVWRARRRSHIQRGDGRQNIEESAISALRECRAKA